MIQISQIKLPCGSDGGPCSTSHPRLEAKSRKLLRLPKGHRIKSFRIVRHSVDARHKPELYDIYSVLVTTDLNERQEAALVRSLKNKNICVKNPMTYVFPAPAWNALRLPCRPLIAGSGPAGLFCAYLLAQNGYRPLVLERGLPMEERVAAVGKLWQEGTLNPSGNAQFGEGGAGTFSDGKLNSNVKDHSGRTDFVLQTFCKFGAPQDILYEYHPHIGTDILRSVVVHMREEIIRLGGEFLFETKAGALVTENGALRGVHVLTKGGDKVIPAKVLVLATGHSARDTIRTLYAQKVPMEQKAFAVGVRVSHPQELINQQQYGISDPQVLAKLHLPASSYKLVTHASSGRGVYSFCMCPGGYIVNASSEPGRLAVNGMSDYARDAQRANSAIVVTVGAEEFGSRETLAGLVFQEKLEERAFLAGGGCVPVQPYGDFRDRADTRLEKADAQKLCIKGQAVSAPVHKILPETLHNDIVEGIEAFDRKIPGFAGEEAYVCGVESRTSSPVRILRDENLESSVRGLYPCGEGAGYAGGITSAAVDGIKTAEAVARRWLPMEDREIR